MPKLTELAPIPIPPPLRVGAARVRSHDIPVTTAEYKKRLAQCRRTTQIGETIFRCDQRHEKDLTTHSETGIVKRKGKPDVHYTIDWNEAPPVVIRNA